MDEDSPKIYNLYKVNFVLIRPDQYVAWRGDSLPKVSNALIDLVIGGFPCQPFSTVNPTKRPDKKESQLFWE